MRMIKIKTPARLHFGVINIKNADFRFYGSLGLALENPYNLIEILPSNKLSFNNFKRNDIIERVKSLVDKTPLERKISVNLIKEIPAHVGLGSTTQLTLAISEGYFLANNLNFDPYKYAADLQIGKISGIGLGAYLYGGFLIDKGKNSPDEIPIIEFRSEFPDDWAFILILDKSKKRVYGEEETEFFKTLPITPSKRIIEMLKIIKRIKISLKDHDIAEFGKNLTELQYNVGLNFYEAQKGIFVNEEYVDILIKTGAYGVGQSSWGPVVYGLFYKDELDRIKEKILEITNYKVEVITSYANNYGRSIEKFN